MSTISYDDRQMDRNHDDDFVSADRMKVLSLIAVGSFIFFFYITYSGAQGLLQRSEQGQAEVIGVSVNSETSAQQKAIDFRVDNSSLGEASLEMNVSTPMRVAGAEMDFRIDGNLEITDVICSTEFVCAISKVESDRFQLSILRPPGLGDRLLSGSIEIATLLYDPLTYGELVYAGESESSMALEVGSSNNLLDRDEKYLAIGQP